MSEGYRGEVVTMITQKVVGDELTTDYEVWFLGWHLGLRNLVLKLWYSVGSTA
jgi:hypothetical protein